MELLDILYDFNCQYSWTETLDKIEQAVLDYNEAIADEEENPGEFLYGCLPVYWQIVRQHNTHQWGDAQLLPSNSQYDVGIFLVGFSSLPIVLSIAEIQPRQKIYFLHSPETRNKCDEITNRITEILIDPPAPFNPLICNTDAAALINRVQCADRRAIANPSDPVETFKQIKGIIDEARKNIGHSTEIALDLTGGKKTMIGGGFTAGSILGFADSIRSSGFDMFYVDSSEYDSDRGAPKPGTEFLSRLDNPYNVYNVQSVQQAEKLFEKHNYEAAADLWEEVEKKLTTSVRGSKSPAEQYGLNDEQKMVQSNLAMANCYKLWDAFDYNGAKKYKLFSFYDPAAKQKLTGSWEYNGKHVHKAIDPLNILSKTDNRKTTFEKESRVIHLAIDRYQNAMRRKQAGKFDDAIGRFVQTLEIICPYFLYQIAQTGDVFLRDSKECLKDKIDPDKEDWNITSLIRFLFKFKGCTEYFGIKGAYVIKTSDKHLKENEYGQVSSILKLIRFRNDLVHVNRSTRQQEIERNADNLQKLAKKFLENLSRDYREDTCLSFDALLELHEFRR